MFKKWLVQFGLWLARCGGWKDPVLYGGLVSDDLLESARLMASQAEKIPGGGEYRRREVLRSLMNRHPTARVKDMALAIELAIR